jgi:hypothetical protein
MVCARFRGAKSYEPEARASESPETVHSLALRARIRVCATGSSQRSVFPLDASAPPSRIPGRDSGRHDSERPRRHSHAARQRDQPRLGIPLMTHSTVFPIGCGASGTDLPVAVNSATGCIHRAISPIASLLSSLSTPEGLARCSAAQIFHFAWIFYLLNWLSVTEQDVPISARSVNGFAKARHT